MDKKNKHLYYLHELSDYKISSKDPDVRGWDVKDSDNRVIGKVNNLLVNKNIEKVVYLDVEVDKTIIEANHDPYGKPANTEVHEFINHDGENHIIIPIGLVNLNEDQKYVYTDTIDHRTFAETKRMEKGTAINRNYEEVVLESYNRDISGPKESERRTGESAYKSDRRKDRDAYDSREDDPDYQEQKLRYSDSAPDEDFDEDYQRRKQRREAGREYRGDTDALEREKEKRSQGYERESPYSNSVEKHEPQETRRDRPSDEVDYKEDRKRSRGSDDDDFYERREFDDRNFRRRRE